ncbi:PQQ-dependent sugar dehydrogenase [Zoogloea sp.]|uniref:PQQ-dependent sugar dehydrogenase n=1 Tax=Zoogloea sp. TaxID=49181 RepID=UPI00141682B4|nr:MAG: PQQ-dependent sugar dehydrogenase [Zoogloea sp.]
MKRQILRSATMMAGVLVALSLAGPARALPGLVNGGFEAGLSGWTTANQTGSEGTFYVQGGTLSPSTGETVPPPPEGTSAAMSDSGLGGPGSHVLYQDFVASAGSASLSFQLFIGNRADAFYTPATLDFATSALNQQARVDILKASADPFSVAGGDVLMTLYQSAVGDPLVDGYSTIVADISAILAAHDGETLRLRFAETDNVFFFQMGVDDVRIEAKGGTVPEPASAALLGLALGAMALCRRGRSGLKGALAVAGLLVGMGAGLPAPARADSIPVQLLDPSLTVQTVVSSGLNQPIGIVFLGPNDFLVPEKASGQIKRVINGVVQPVPVLDLAVNSASERGLLSVVLHPAFPTVPFVYVFWTESLSGVDSTALSDTPLLGNRVDRFVWGGGSLVLDHNLLRLRSRQTDNVAAPGHPDAANPAERGNHNGGVMRFGPDGKLYVFMGEQGRRGWMQNLANGPFLTAPSVDDTFGGPSPDDAHLAGVILRLNPDGTTPADNPFFAAGAAVGGQVGANLQKVFSYGHRNGFGMAFDPLSGQLWETENADDAYSELNRVVPGMNGGWIQLAGPLARVSSWKSIETTQFGGSLQQVRYPPTRAAYGGALAQSRMFMLPGAVYRDPELSWRYEIGPSGASFVRDEALGSAYAGTLWIGSSRAFQQVGGNGGSLYRIRLTPDRLGVDTSADPRLADKVADNLFSPNKFDGSESETLLVGRGFGITPSLEQGPDGALYVVSLSDNVIYRIVRAP